MKIFRPALLVVVTLVLGACANLSGPSAADIARLPVVDYGQSPPADEFVLRYPAGANLPVVTRLEGSLLEKTEQATLTVRIKRDVYVYRDLASLDGKSWQPGNLVVGGRVWMTLPGNKDQKQDAVSAGEIGAEFNLK
ncbi:hypothetical protein [Dechloromonas sp. CZR5]|uniref:hypothetical protein n=1 Tax=Dechloromonas sp. CZR5 TaxID=2608630 RepID=UPI00123D7470|nr:hypothetical protein [Dechloromonas sp. CZR5]